MSTDALRLPSKNPQHQMWQEEQPTRILGVDPGTNGGLAIIVLGGAAPVLAGCVDIPVIGEGAEKSVDAIAVCKRGIKRKIQNACIVQPTAIPGQGPAN